MDFFKALLAFILAILELYVTRIFLDIPPVPAFSVYLAAMLFSTDSLPFSRIVFTTLTTLFGCFIYGYSIYMYITCFPFYGNWIAVSIDAINLSVIFGAGFVLIPAQFKTRAEQNSILRESRLSAIRAGKIKATQQDFDDMDNYEKLMYMSGQYDYPAFSAPVSESVPEAKPEPEIPADPEPSEPISLGKVPPELRYRPCAECGANIPYPDYKTHALCRVCRSKAEALFLMRDDIKPKPAPLYCRLCGAQLHDDSLFCEYCGTPIPTDKQDS